MARRRLLWRIRRRSTNSCRRTIFRTRRCSWNNQRGWKRCSWSCRAVIICRKRMSIALWRATTITNQEFKRTNQNSSLIWNPCIRWNEHMDRRSTRPVRAPIKKIHPPITRVLPRRISPSISRRTRKHSIVLNSMLIQISRQSRVHTILYSIRRSQILTQGRKGALRYKWMRKGPKYRIGNWSRQIMRSKTLNRWSSSKITITTTIRRRPATTTTTMRLIKVIQWRPPRMNSFSSRSIRLRMNSRAKRSWRWTESSGTWVGGWCLAINALTKSHEWRGGLYEVGMTPPSLREVGAPKEAPGEEDLKKTSAFTSIRVQRE